MGGEKYLTRRLQFFGNVWVFFSFHLPLWSDLDWRRFSSASGQIIWKKENRADEFSVSRFFQAEPRAVSSRRNNPHQIILKIRKCLYLLTVNFINIENIEISGSWSDEWNWSREKQRPRGRGWAQLSFGFGFHHHDVRKFPLCLQGCQIQLPLQGR